MFSVRMVTVNHYLSPPVSDLDVTFSDFRNTKVTQVPVIRIFGSTPAGQKTCLHVHGVFPYFYVPCEESEVSVKFMQQLALSIDTALQVGSGNAAKYIQHVFKIIPVSGRQLYGYRSTERQFLKIYFYNPLVIRRASELLQNGVILNRVFQPFECHVPFNLQFFIDYNLYGMNLVNLAAVKFRRSQNEESNPNQNSSNESQLGETSMFNSVSTQHWTPSNIPGSQWLPEDVKRQSSCELEVDGVATDILNRLDLKDNVDTNPGLVAIWEDERQRREQLNQLSQLMPPASPERGEMMLQEAESDWLERLTEVVDEQLKELEEHLPTSEGDASRMGDEEKEEAAKETGSLLSSQPMSNQLVDHLSQDRVSPLPEGNVEAVINEELALSLSQVSVMGLSQAADKDLANLLMELGGGDDIDSDSILSTQTPVASQEEVDAGQKDNAAEEEDAAEKQESLEMSQVWVKDDDSDDDADDDDSEDDKGEETDEKERKEPIEKQELNSSLEENLIPDVEEMSAFSQPELRSSQLPQLDGPNDPMPEKRRKKSKLEMVQEMRAIRASHQLTRSLPSNVGSMSSSAKSPSFLHSLAFGGTNMNLSMNRKNYGHTDGRPPSAYTQEDARLHSQSYPSGLQSKTQTSVLNAAAFAEQSRSLEDSQKKPKRGRPPGSSKKNSGGFETMRIQQHKHQSDSVGGRVPEINQDEFFGSNPFEKSLDKNVKKKRGRPPLNSKQRKDDFVKKSEKGGEGCSKSKSEYETWSATTSDEKKESSVGGPPASSKHEYEGSGDKVPKNIVSSRDGDTVNVVHEEPLKGNATTFHNGQNKKPGRPPKKVKIQFVGMSSKNVGIIKNIGESGNDSSVSKCNKIVYEPPGAKGKKTLSSKVTKTHRTKFSSSKDVNSQRKHFSLIPEEKLSTVESSSSESNSKTFAVNKGKGRPPSSTKLRKGTTSSAECLQPSHRVPDSEENLAIVKKGGLNSLSTLNIKPTKRRGRPPLKWKQKKELIQANKESLVSHASDELQTGTDVSLYCAANGARGFQEQSTKKCVQGLVSNLEVKNSDNFGGRKTLGLAQKKPGKKRGRPPSKKKDVNSQHKSLTNIPTQREEQDRSSDMFLEMSGGDIIDSSSSHLTSTSDENNDETFHGMHSKGPPSLKSLKVKLTKVQLSQQGEEPSNLSQDPCHTDENSDMRGLDDMSEDILGQNVTHVGEMEDLVKEPSEKSKHEKYDRDFDRSKHKRPKHLGMRLPYSYSRKFEGSAEVSVESASFVKNISSNERELSLSNVEKDTLKREESRSPNLVKTADNGPVSNLLCVESQDGKSHTSFVGKRPFEESDVGTVRQTKSSKTDEQVSASTVSNTLPKNVTKDKHNLFLSQLEEGHTINLNDFTSEQLSSMAAFSPKIILYRFGKGRSNSAALSQDAIGSCDDTEIQSTPKLKRKDEMETQTEVASALVQENSEKISPLLLSAAQQKKYVPANSKAGKQKSVSEKRGGGRMEYSLLAGFRRYAKRKQESSKSSNIPREVLLQSGNKDDNQSEVIDLTSSSSPEGADKSSPEEIEILGVHGQKKDSEKKSERPLWTTNKLSGTKKKSRLSRGSRPKKVAEGKSPVSSPSLKSQLQFFVTPSKSSPSKSPKSSQSSRGSKTSSQKTPQSSQQNASQTPKRGRGRPRKLKLDGVSQADVKKKQNKEISDYFPVAKRDRGDKTGNNEKQLSGGKEADKDLSRDTEEDVSFIQFLSGENNDNINLPNQETKLDEIIDLLKDDDTSAVLTVENEVEISPTPSFTDEDIQAIDRKETSDSVHCFDPKYPFLRTPSSSPYRDVLWNMSFTSPAVSSPRESPPKYWSPTDQTKKSTFESDKSEHSGMLKSDSESQFDSSLDQNSNKEGYSKERRDSKDTDGRDSPSLSMSEMGEYGNSQMALFEELQTPTTSEENFENKVEPLNEASDCTVVEASTEGSSEAAPLKESISEASKGGTIPKSTSFSPEEQNGKKKSEGSEVEKISGIAIPSENTVQKNDLTESGKIVQNDGGGNGDEDELLIPYPTTIPESMSEASESGEDSSPLELMDSVSQIELLQSQLDAGTAHVSGHEIFKEGNEMTKSNLDLSGVEEIVGVGKDDLMQSDSMNETDQLPDSGAKGDGDSNPVIGFQGTASQAQLLSFLDDTFGSEISHEESRSGLESTGKRSSSSDGEKIDSDESGKEKAQVDGEKVSNSSLRDDINIFEMIGSLYKIPPENQSSYEKSTKVESKDNAPIEEVEERSFEGSSYPVPEYQQSTMVAEMLCSTADADKLNELAGLEKSRNEDDHTTESKETNDGRGNLLPVGGSSPILEFQGSSSQMNSLQKLESLIDNRKELTVEDFSQKGQRMESLLETENDEKSEEISKYEGRQDIENQLKAGGDKKDGGLLETEGRNIKDVIEMGEGQKNEGMVEVEGHTIDNVTETGREEKNDISGKGKEEKTEDLLEIEQEATELFEEVQGEGEKVLDKSYQTDVSEMNVESSSIQNLDVNEKEETGVTEPRTTEDKMETEDEIKDGSTGDKPEIIESEERDHDTHLLTESDVLDNLVQVEKDCEAIHEQGKDLMSTEVSISVEESDVPLLEKSKSSDSAISQEDTSNAVCFTRVKVGGTEEQVVKKMENTVSLGGSVIGRELKESNKKDLDVEVVLESNKSDNVKSFVEKGGSKQCVEGIVKNGENSNGIHSHNDISISADRKIPEMETVHRSSTLSVKGRNTAKSCEDSSESVKVGRKRKNLSDLSNGENKHSESNQNQAKRNRRGSSSDGSRPIDLSQYGIEKELNIPLRRLSLDDLPPWNRSGTSCYDDDDDGSRSSRRPAVDFESMFMIEHSQFQLSDSSEHDKSNPCDLQDLETSLNLQDSGMSDFEESSDDFERGKAKPKSRKGRKESPSKKRKLKSEKKTQRKSENAGVGRKKRKGELEVGSELSNQEVEENPPIKMVFRKVKHTGKNQTTPRVKKKKTTQSNGNWKLSEKTFGEKEIGQTWDNGEILSGQGSGKSEQLGELKPLILRKVNSNGNQTSHRGKSPGFNNEEKPSNSAERLLAGNFDNKDPTPQTFKQIKGLEMEQGLNTDAVGVGLNVSKQRNTFVEENRESIQKENDSLPKNEEFEWKEREELLSTGCYAESQNQLNFKEQGFQTVKNFPPAVEYSHKSQVSNISKGTMEPSEMAKSESSLKEGVSSRIAGQTTVTDAGDGQLERGTKEDNELEVGENNALDLTTHKNMQRNGTSVGSFGEQVFNKESHATVADGTAVVQKELDKSDESHTRKMHKLDMSMRSRLNTAETEVIEALMGLSNDGSSLSASYEQEYDSEDSPDLIPSFVGFTEEEAHEIECATSLLEKSTDDMLAVPTGEEQSCPDVKPLPSTDQPIQGEAQDVESEQFVDQDTSHEKEGPQDIPCMQEGNSNALLGGVYIPIKPPPTRTDIESTLSEYGLTDVVHQLPYWEKNADIPSFTRETANMQVQLNQNLPGGLKEALPPSSSLGLDHWRTEMFVRDQSHIGDSPEVSFYSEEGKAIMKGILESATYKMEVILTPCKLPPDVSDVTKWLDNQKTSKNKTPTVLKATNSSSRTLPKPKSKEMKEKQNRIDNIVKRLSGERQRDAGSPQSYLEEAPPSPFLQELIDQVEPTTPPMVDTPESPPNRSVSEIPPCHSTPLPTGIKGKPTQPSLTPILITATKKTEPRLKKRVSLVDLPKIEQPKVVTPGQTSMVTPLAKKGSFTSQLEGPTPKNTCAFKFSQSNLQDAKALHENQHLTLMSLELHVHTRGKLRPDPDFDPVRAIFFCIASENYGEGVGDGAHSEYVGVITVDNPNKNQLQTPTSNRPLLSSYGLPDVKVINASDEMEMFEKFIDLVQSHDPDFLIGYEIQQLSWGYLLDRASALDVKLCSRMSRLPDNEKDSHFSSEKDAFGSDHTSEIHIAGRIVLNVWRLLRHEIALNVYTFENVAYHVLHQRVPLYSFQDLSAWYDHQTHLLRWRVVEHYIYRVIGNLKILKQTDLIGRTSELARLFGIQFFSVLSRGTQYRVESMMLRQAKSQNYVALSPSVQQRAVMKAPECLPLILEPESKLYEDPVIVLDFQSLYPSMMIGYNYCFSTCVGRVEHIAKGGHFVLGCTTHYLPPKQIKQLLDSGGLHISPNGVVFVKKSVRHGILPRMLEQILQTRIMVKKGLKDHKQDKVLQRMLDNRQLGLKLIANVTYGYTSASFSGRMPCIEVGDSIVMKARETLERSIHLIENTPKWGARVVYGDTDSMFVMVKGATKERAFEVGNEIVAAVSKVNPKPVKLKLEKVYKPCVLQAKKRYVGFKYESPDQKEPDFEAKGIETVRRDTCPAVAKILEKSLKIIFTTQNMSQVKEYVQKQFQKIIDGRINQQDLVFAKEYRGHQYYKPGACIPALELTKRSLAVDKRSEPRVGERVPYVIVNGIPGLPLIQLVRRPEELASDPTLIINSAYYITRQLVPSLNRVYGIMGVETLQWYQELPRNLRVTTAPTTVQSNQSKKGTISQYFCSLNCIICDQLTKTGLCEDCRKQPQLTAAALSRKIQEYQRSWIHLTKICRSCTGCPEHQPSCISIDCPNRFKIIRSSQKMESIPHLVQLLSELPAS